MGQACHPGGVLLIRQVPRSPLGGLRKGPPSARVCAHVWKHRWPMELGLHLPLMEFGDEGQSLSRLGDAVDAARDAGFAAVSANDHFLFATPWLDGLTALAAMIERTGEMTLATTITLASLRGPVPLAKTLAAVDLLSGGRLVAGVGPGSSKRDYDALGVAFDDRWKRRDEAVAILRALLRGTPPPRDTRYFSVPGAGLAPAPHQDGGVPLWIGSWGSEAGLRRVARLGDGWLASAYNTTPERFAAARAALFGELRARGRDPNRFPNAIATMFFYVTEDRATLERIVRDVLTPTLRRPEQELRELLLVGSTEDCAQKLAAYRAAGAQRIFLWPVEDELRQLATFQERVAPLVPS